MEFLQESSPYYNANNQQFTPEKRHNDSKTDHFVVDDLLDFPVDLVEEDVDIIEATSTDSSTVVDSCNSSSLGSGGPEPSFVDTQLSNLFVPYDDLAEFEWLSNSVEESFSNEDLQKFQLISGIKARSKYASDAQEFQTMAINRTNNPIFNIDMTVPSKARTKRSRASSCNWASQVCAMSSAATMASNCESNITSSSIAKSAMTTVKKDTNNNSSRNDDGRKCLHCATDKTPQWRTGPMGPRTLCNACGVRYKSGRLVPEYRPVASPTFVLTKHSNSHRKVLELRRKKEMKNSQHHHQHFLNDQNIMSHMPNRDTYLIHQRIDPYYQQLI
ncbi:Transcription factor, GATA [Artemisia annua]|uniref:GATA transcription factor n=1 Tax=Artemisia annua TaxID=35608 RepID=A0A2U1NXM2_ARTAN|nr:Transcription factor, GATA [Artemisia annua]